ncbi:MAG: hypothetical protein VX568_07990, partial [Actinomycetota bacterium]|nr:hypothetical protein [Actinomycetota bacterium]
MLDEQQMGIASSVEAALKFERLSIGNAPKPSHPERAQRVAQSSAIQLRVSKISFTRRKKPAAYAP